MSLVAALWRDVIGEAATCLRSGAAMPVETCFLCRTADHSRNLGLWLVNDEKRPVHLDCWLAAYARARTRDDGER
jgi:hypothetical protein